MPFTPGGESVRVLVALGGNAMTAADGSARPEDQVRAITGAMEHIAELAAAGHDVVLTHGNGPQVGNLLVKNELSARVVPPVPLDWCGAQTQGTIGFTMLDALEPALRRRGINRPVAALVTRSLVTADDPHFLEPTKPIGRYLPADEARRMIEHGQQWEDRGEKGWRRVVASPEPREILDLAAIRALVDSGHIVVAAGGGGIPVVREPDGTLHGVEAVIDKDLTAALLARTLGCDILIIATDVDHAMVDYGTPQERPLGFTSLAQMQAFASDGQFASGSMGPKVDAALRFAETGGRSIITSLEHITDAVENEFGTVIDTSPED